MRFPKRPPLLVWFLGATLLVFVTMLVFTWIAADRANPVILDERGQPR